VCAIPPASAKSRTEYAAGTAARRQIDQLDPPTGEEGIATDKNGVGPIGHKTCERCIDLATGAGVEDPDQHPGAAMIYSITSSARC
jgi:hypothetical protein